MGGCRRAHGRGAVPGGARGSGRSAQQSLAADRRALCQALGAGRGPHTWQALPDYRSAPVAGRRCDAPDPPDAHHRRQSPRYSGRPGDRRSAGVQALYRSGLQRRGALDHRTVRPLPRRVLPPRARSAAGPEPAQAPRGAGLHGGLAVNAGDLVDTSWLRRLSLSAALLLLLRLAAWFLWPGGTPLAWVGVLVVLPPLVPPRMHLGHLPSLPH